jgi:hypothetical protein
MWLGSGEQIQFGLTLLVMVLALATLALSLQKQWFFFKSLALPAFLCTALLTCGVIYLSSLIPGILGLMRLPFEYGLFLAINVLLIKLLPRFTLTPLVGKQEQRTWTYNPLQLALVILGLILCAPLLHHLKELPLQLSRPNGILAWDVVSYHLPALIEFTQHQSLWSMQGPFQSYGFGFELIAAFFSKPFYAHWGWVLGHWLSITLIALAILSINQTLAHSRDSASRFRAITISALALGMFSTMEYGTLGAIGKNDLFMAAMVITSLALLMTSTRSDASSLSMSSASQDLRRKWALGITCLCAGLALATKPSALGFALLVPIAIGVINWQRSQSWQTVLRVGLISSALVYVIGGFWLTRNLVIFHTLSPVLDGGWRHSVLANLTNPDLYRLRFNTIYIGFAILALPCSVILALREQPLAKQFNVWSLIVAFHLCALITLLITPFMIQQGAWELRLAAPLLLSTAIIWSAAIERGCTVVEQYFSERRGFYLGGAISIGLMIILALTWQTQRSAPLPGYDQVGALPKTGVYRWAWEQEAPLRIYSAGLRPYGLYGKHWQHALFYDLHSAELNDLAYGKARLASVVQYFDPQVILISTDPLQSMSATTTPSKPAITTWMNTQSDLFEPIYSDGAVSGYRVLPAAKVRLQEWLRDNMPPKMGG